MELEQILRASGNRVTTPRRLVWEVLMNTEDHLTADEVATAVTRRDASVNLSSVYRTLALFSALDVVRESNLGGDGISRWELAHPDDHFHLVCEGCGSVDHHVGALVDEIRRHLSDGHGFTPDTVDLVVTGWCRRCQPQTRN